MDTAKDQVVKKLLEYGQVLSQQEQKFTPHNEEADKLIKENPTAFLFAVIMDQGARAEYIWEIPYRLKQLLGHLDVSKIAAMTDEELDDVFRKLPRKPRYRNKMVRWIKSACQRILDEYQGQAEKIWADNPRAGKLQSRLDKFDGIGEKKASMATNILYRDLRKPIQAPQEIDVSYDIMVRRVFLRAGLCDYDSEQAIVSAAKQLNPDYPGALDLPCWVIGRTWCDQQKPKCDECVPPLSKCPISEICPRRL